MQRLQLALLCHDIRLQATFVASILYKHSGNDHER